MNGAPPPPPPPHGESPRTTSDGLPKGKYDIFIIPEHSAGSGFLYLPNMATNTNSVILGTALGVVLTLSAQGVAPLVRAWWSTLNGIGNLTMMMLVLAVGLGAWALGRQSQDGPGGGSGGGSHSRNGSESWRHQSQAPPPQPTSSPPPQSSAPPPPPPQNGPSPGASRPAGAWQQHEQAKQQQQAPPPPKPSPKPEMPKAEAAKSAWERAREETRRKEEERKAKEAEQKRKDEAAQRLKEMREREAQERIKREQERLKKEKEAAAVREKAAKEKEAKEAKEKQEKEAKDTAARKASTYAFSGAGERTNPWPNGKPSVATPPISPQKPAPPPQATTTASPPKRPPAPTAKTFVGTDDDGFSYRPYDTPRRPNRRMSTSEQSDFSWAPSASTAQTTPPTSHRAPYSTKDPDKIVIKAVYSFANQFSKSPASQLISGIGSVTDGLILRITTEGLFIDDDVRGVAQREWDVKAWTLKSVEVWCPSHHLASARASNSSPATAAASAKPSPATALFKKTTAAQKAAQRGEVRMHSGDDADGYLTELLASCQNSCRLELSGAKSSAYSGSSMSDEFYSDDGSASFVPGRTGTNAQQTGDWKAKGLHLLRATLKDQDGKKYLFVVTEPEAWKVAVGLQRLRRGTQVRGLGVAGMNGLEVKNTLETLGWGQ